MGPVSAAQRFALRSARDDNGEVGSIFSATHAMAPDVFPQNEHQGEAENAATHFG